MIKRWFYDLRRAGPWLLLTLCTGTVGCKNVERVQQDPVASIYERPPFVALEGTSDDLVLEFRGKRYNHLFSHSYVFVVSTFKSPNRCTFGREVRKTIGEAAELQDAETADMFREISRGKDKWLWFVEAHSQAKQ